jgi:hypothetical protein
MTSLSAGVFRSPKTSRSSFEPKAARAGCMGAHACDRLGLAESEHSGTDLGPTSYTVLGSETPCFLGTESDREGKGCATATGLLRRQRIFLGRCDSLRTAHPVEGNASLSFLEWSSVENHSQPRNGSRQRAMIALPTLRPEPLSVTFCAPYLCRNLYNSDRGARGSNVPRRSARSFIKAKNTGTRIRT